MSKDSGANPALAKAEPASRLGPPGFDPGEGWQHVLEDGSLDHEWVTESGVTFCAQCEAPKPEAD